MNKESTPFEIKVNFKGETEETQPPNTVVYAFDSTGKFLASAPLKKERAEINLPESVLGRAVKFLFGPPLDKDEVIKISRLRRKGAFERRLLIDPEDMSLNMDLFQRDWSRWIICSCKVRGKVVVRIPLPDGTVQEMPVCNARVTICEVDSLLWIIKTLPEKYLFRLRDEFLRAIREPIPIPDPIPDWIDPERFDPLPDPPKPPPPPPESFGGVILSSRMFTPQPEPPAPERFSSNLRQPMLLDGAAREYVRNVELSNTVTVLRENLIAARALIHPFLCFWPWFPIIYVKDCFVTVMVDQNGEFETTVYYPCFGDKPDLYFKVEQLHGGIWETIYEPPVPCFVHWNYECGKEVTLNITDPSVVLCVPPMDVDPPPGISTWIMPYQVGRTEIWGTPPGTPTPLPSSPGWVKPDGLTDYGGTTDAPFGGYLGFVMGHSNDIPNSGMKYYRWSYRKVGDTELKHMEEPVVRHYIKQSPGELPSFPTCQLGHHTVGGNQYLYEFKPLSPPGADPGDPPGTTTAWPLNNFFGSDTYSGFLNTNADASVNGQYEIWLEVFDNAGNLITPGSGTFDFIVPDQVLADQSVEARASNDPVEIKTEMINSKTHVGFVFNLHIEPLPSTSTVEVYICPQPADPGK